ncbi:MAG: SDR family NAD(P)-dependent oxidoreductase [Flavobacteriaceae bacterium]|nr:SDR family NAD(P)-dependent oxidoreductase [Flavobacteriaceae bacterium]
MTTEKRNYALVTGASKGLGKAMCFQLAKRGIDLILVALPNSGLVQLASFIEKNEPIDVHHIEADLSNRSGCDKVIFYVYQNRLELKYLINNAGILSRGFFDDSSIDFVLSQIHVNSVAPAYLTHGLLENLRSNSPSAILNVSSMAGFFPLPVKQVYCATKSFITAFSRSLRWELAGENISVSVLCPGGLNTTTKISCQNRTLGWFNQLAVLSPEQAAQEGIDGMLKGRDVIIPGWVNRFYLLLDKILPRKIKNILISKEMKRIGLLDRDLNEKRHTEIPQRKLSVEVKLAEHLVHN